MININSITGVVLAGGLAKRMGGGDKCLLPLGGKTLLQRTIDRAKPQVDQLILNANGNSLRFARSRLPVVADLFDNFPGPLAGVHAGLSYMKAHYPTSEWLVSFASDTPFFPLDMVYQMRALAAQKETKLVVACSKALAHPVFALWHNSLHGPMEQQLKKGETPRLQDWVEAQKPVYLDFPVTTYDPFLNINTPQDLYNAEAQLSLVQMHP